MTTKDIRTAQDAVSCDVCGRTLLRGETSDTYLAGGARREVCELCTPRAIHEGWVREGAALERGTRAAPGDRRRSLLSRLRRPREDAGPGNGTVRGDEPGWPESAPSRGERAASLEPAREPRQVRAVPTSVEQRTAAAIELFNHSEHPRTVAGVARSLGAPVVVVRPLEEHGSAVTIVVSWELCWYRYEVDLSDEGAAVRSAGQGYELEELEPVDRVQANAVADEYGTLTPA
jgi:hypothetical protein